MKKTERILKLICGAGNEDLKEIEKLSFVYASAGFNIIDTAAKIDAINMVKRAIQKAGRENEVSVCISIGLQDDIHLSKAVINNQKCTKCRECIIECKRNAIFEDDNKFLVDEKKCIGCAKCIKICPSCAITGEHKYRSPSEMLLPVLGESVDCVEFHCTSSDENQIIESLNRIKSIYNGQISICMNRSKLGDERIISILREMTNEEKDIIIQADGNPMSGSVNDYKSNVQAVSFGELIRNSDIKAILVLSGGTNAKTSEFAKLCGVKIDGVALGSYARKLVNEYIKREDFWENKDVRENAINCAKELAEELLKNL